MALVRCKQTLQFGELGEFRGVPVGTGSIMEADDPVVLAWPGYFEPVVATHRTVDGRVDYAR